MPEYLAPGVYVEEVPTGAKPIQGVGTSTAAFVGAALSGPIATPVGPITSLLEFERAFGEATTLAYPGSPPVPAFLWHAARSFFTEGGKRLWAVRAARRDTDHLKWPRSEDFQHAIEKLEAVPEIATIAAPGSTFMNDADLQVAAETSMALIRHAEHMRYRIAVLDAPNGRTVEQVSAWRERFTSTRAVLCFPWLKVAQPSGSDLLPASPSFAGICARTDTNRGVAVSPAGETVHGVAGVELAIDEAHAADLDAQGVSCIRWFPDRGVRLWSARTLSADPEWKYVNVRRYLIFVERSIDQGLQWAVFEPNGEVLWESVRRAVWDFLFNEWQHGALTGTKADDAFFVRCDRTTMAQHDVDSSRVVVLVGIAAAQPAQFVMLRIVVQTGRRR